MIDILKNEIFVLEKKYPFLKNEKSPSNSVGYTPSKNFKKINSRKDADFHLSNYIEDERVRQFLLKNLYWIDKENLGLKLNIKILSEFTNKLSIRLKNDLKFDNPYLFLYGENSPYVNESDFPLIKKYFSNVQIIKVPLSGHWVHADNPSFFLDKTINFLN